MVVLLLFTGFWCTLTCRARSRSPARRTRSPRSSARIVAAADKAAADEVTVCANEGDEGEENASDAGPGTTITYEETGQKGGTFVDDALPRIVEVNWKAESNPARKRVTVTVTVPVLNHGGWKKN